MFSEFRPVRGYWFTSYLISELERLQGCADVTLDIGITKSRVCVWNGEAEFGELRVSLAELRPSEEDRVVIVESNGDIYEVVKRDRGFYKLKAISCCSPPTLEINGIHMHRIKDIDPLADSVIKVKAARVRAGDVVLDTCMGLGYTALSSLRLGAREVYTVEIDENVIWIAERNPWSSGLSSPNVRIIRGDVTAVVKGFEDERFDKIIHDPPRFSGSTGELYSAEFYRELFRVLKPGGVMFHYTGEPRRHGAPSILKGIKERLTRAGFITYFDERAQGFICIKPRARSRP